MSPVSLPWTDVGPIPPGNARWPTVRLADGTLAGSVLTMDRAFANWLSIGLTPEDVVRRTSTIACVENRNGVGQGGMVNVKFPAAFVTPGTLITAG